MNTLSVVIPTYNRCEILEKAIRAYQQQRLPEAVAEILVVDDGSPDPTAKAVARLSRDSAIPIRYFRQPNRGPAAARNLGIRAAAGQLILFTDDDIVPGPDLVAEHLGWHRRFSGRSVAVLGYVDWAPEVRATPFMKWYGRDGPLFAYAHFERQVELEDCRFFYSCNLSLKTEFLREYGAFDEDFKTAAYEDVELGYRLKKAGLQLLYNPRAVGYHDQYVSFADACRRAAKTAGARRVFDTKEAGMREQGNMLKGGSPSRRADLDRWVMRWVAPALSRFRFLLDSRIPLPWSVYRLAFRTCRCYQVAAPPQSLTELPEEPSH